MKHVILAVVLAGLAAPALAEGAYQDDNELRLVQAIFVEVIHEAKGGCLPQPNVLKTEAELILRRSGITGALALPIFVLEIRIIAFEILLVGNESGSAKWCAGTADAQLLRLGRVPEGHTAAIVAYQAGPLLRTGIPKPEMQARLRDYVSEVVTDLANEILKARGH